MPAEAIQAAEVKAETRQESPASDLPSQPDVIGYGAMLTVLAGMIGMAVKYLTVKDRRHSEQCDKKDSLLIAALEKKDAAFVATLDKHVEKCDESHQQAREFYSEQLDISRKESKENANAIASAMRELKESLGQRQPPRSRK